jgi:hypothetical protein
VNKLQNAINELATNINDSLGQRIMAYAEALGISPYLIIQNWLISEWAKKTARIKFEGTNTAKIMPEFQWEIKDGQRELVTGEALFNNLVEYYTQELKAEHPEKIVYKESKNMTVSKTPDGERVFDIRD